MLISRRKLYFKILLKKVSIKNLATKVLSKLTKYIIFKKYVTYILIYTI